MIEGLGDIFGQAGWQSNQVEPLRLCNHLSGGFKHDKQSSSKQHSRSKHAPHTQQQQQLPTAAEQRWQILMRPLRSLKVPIHADLECVWIQFRVMILTIKNPPPMNAAGDEEVQYLFVSLPSNLDPVAFGPGSTVTLEVTTSLLLPSWLCKESRSTGQALLL